MDEPALRVLVVASKFAPEYAGSSLRIENTYRRLTRRHPSLQWRVLCNSVEHEDSSRYLHDGIPVRRIASRLARLHLAGRSRSAWQRLLGALGCWWQAICTLVVLWRESFDVLHVFGTSASPAAAVLWSRLFHVPVIVELVTTGAVPAQTLPALRFPRQTDMRERAVVVAISAALGERCHALGLRENVWVRPNPVDVDRFNPQPQRRHPIRRSLTPFTEQDCLIASVAKFMPQKNQVFMVDVLACLPERYKLVLAGPLVGEGPLCDRDNAYLDAIRQAVALNGLEHRVQIDVGLVDAAEYMQMCDVYVMPSTNEGLGTPMLESFATGVPVVANDDQPAFREWIDTGVNGFVVPLDAALWADAVVKAEALPAATLARSTERIRYLASTEVLDERFYVLLDAVARSPRGRTPNVARLLADGHAG